MYQCSNVFEIYSKLSFSKGIFRSLATGLLKIPFEVFTFTTRTNLSGPLYTYVIRPRGHWSGATLSSVKYTRSPIPKFSFPLFNFKRSCEEETYSFVQRFQKLLIKFCKKPNVFVANTFGYHLVRKMFSLGKLLSFHDNKGVPVLNAWDPLDLLTGRL